MSSDMEPAAKMMFGVPAKHLLCCISQDFPAETEPNSRKYLKWKTVQPPVPKPLSQKQKDKREKAFSQRKAERASMRAQLREKYQLPKNRTDRKQLETAGMKTKLPLDLQAIVKSKTPPESSSFFSSWGALDFSSLRTTAENAVQSLQGPVRQCPIM